MPRYIIKPKADEDFYCELIVRRLSQQAFIFEAST